MAACTQNVATLRGARWRFLGLTVANLDKLIQKKRPGILKES
jgi:hypothetical protein